MSESNMQSTSCAFRVEIRCTGRPIPMGDTYICNDWVPLPLVRLIRNSLGYSSNGRLAEGAPPASQTNEDAMTDTYSYMAAVALAATILAQYPYTGLEARLVEYRRKISWELERIEELPFESELEASMDRAQRRSQKNAQSE